MTPIVKVRRARRTYRCDIDGGSCCLVVIQPGTQYVRATLPPQRGANYGDHWWTLRICEGCDAGDNIGNPTPRPELTEHAVDYAATRERRAAS